MKPEDKQRNYELAEKLFSEQNFSAALVAGAIAALLAAAFYGITTSKWDFSYGFAAAGIGIAVGISMQYLGRGIVTKFAVAAALYTIAGCVLGNLFRAVIDLARGDASSPPDVFRSHDFSALAAQAISYVSFIDLVFWLVAIWFAVFLVKRPLSRVESLALGMHELKG